MCFQTSYEENKEIAERNKQESDMQTQVKLYKGFQEMQPEMSDKLHDRLKEILKINNEQMQEELNKNANGTPTDLPADGDAALLTEDFADKNF